MSVSYRDLISIQEAARRLNTSMDQVMFLVEKGSLTGYWPGNRKYNIVARFTDDPILPEWIPITLPISWDVEKILPSGTQPIPKEYLKIDAAGIERLLQRARKEKTIHRDDALDFVLRRAVDSLNGKGANWTYRNIIQEVKRLFMDDKEVSDRVKCVDTKKWAIHWNEGVWSKDSVSVKTIKDRLSKLAPKKSRPRRN